MAIYPTIAIIVFFCLLGVFFLLLLATSTIGRFIKLDNSPLLRCSSEACGRITKLAYVKNAGFGDNPIEIEYQFHNSTGRMFTGHYVGTESSFHGVTTGDQLLVRYDENNPETNAPRDALGIITPLS